MSVYKEPVEWLCQSIDSILNQTISDFEFIIVCDNPYGVETIRLLNDYAEKDNRINLIFNDDNIGLTRSLNKGLKMACGKYIARMDADDISLPRRFEKQLDYMEKHPEVIVLGTNLSYIGDVPFYYKFMGATAFDDYQIKASLLFGNCIVHSSVFIRKSVLDKEAIRYDEHYGANQDFRLWELLANFGKYHILKDKLIKYRISKTQITKTKSAMQRKQSYSINIRLQKQWLDKNKIYLDYLDLEKHPYNTLCELKTKKFIRNQLEYKMFLQFVYISSIEETCRIKAIINGDFWSFTMRNKLLYIIKMLKGIGI